MNNKQIYLFYIKLIIEKFKIEKEIEFRDEAAIHLSNISSYKNMESWNSDFFEIVLKFSSLSPQEIKDNIEEDINNLISIEQL
ncbi:MAG: hypothetical protein ACOC1O_00900 [bacterium]